MSRRWREPSGSAAAAGRHRREFLDITCPRRDWTRGRSSVGQSRWLIAVQSQVRGLPAPPSKSTEPCAGCRCVGVHGHAVGHSTSGYRPTGGPGRSVGRPCGPATTTTSCWTRRRAGRSEGGGARSIRVISTHPTFMSAEPRRRQEKRPSSRSLLGNGVEPPWPGPPLGWGCALACDLPCLLGCTAPLAPCVWPNPDLASGSCTSSRGDQRPFVTMSLCWSTPGLSQCRGT